MPDVETNGLTAKEAAAARRRTCSRCVNSQHDLCTLDRCEHFGCPADDDELDEPDEEMDVPIDPPTKRAAPQPEVIEVPDGVDWADPPPKMRRSRSREAFDAIESALRANPGRWARVLTTSTPKGGSNAAKAIRQPDFEVASRGGSVYVRYRGPAT